MIQVHVEVRGLARDAHVAAAKDRGEQIEAERTYCGSTNIMSNLPIGSQQFKSDYYELFATEGNGKDVHLKIQPIFLEPDDPVAFGIELIENGFCLRVTDQVRIYFYKWHARAFLLFLGDALQGLLSLKETIDRLPLDLPYDPDSGFPRQEEDKPSDSDDDLEEEDDEESD